MLKYVFNLLQPSSKRRLNPKTLPHSRVWHVAGLVLAGLILTCSAPDARAASSDAARHAAAKYVQIPLSFEPNKGQTDSSVRFLSRGSGYSLFLTQDEVVLSLERQNAPAATTGQKLASRDTLRMKLVGANSNTDVTGTAPQSGVVSYLIGNDPNKWHTGIQTLGKVNFAQVYPGVDLVFYGNQRQLEYDFVVAPGADASRIAWQIDGAQSTIDADGNLVLSAANGPAGFKKPVLSQMDGDRKVAVEGAFTVAANRIGFQIGSYDHSKPLIIDPVLTYASYLGGSGNDSIGSIPNYNGSGNPYAGTAVTQGIGFDSDGSAYVVGSTTSTDFPTSNPYQSTNNESSGNASVFITKFSPDGSSLAYSTYVGGSGTSKSSNGMAIAVDSSGEAFVTGWTNSADFPTTPGAFQTICAPGSTDWWAPAETTTCPGGNMSPFLLKLNAAGSGLVYSTFLGGAGNALGEAIAIDAAGRAYLVGDSETACQGPGYQGVPTPYSCFPTTSGAIISGTQVDGSDYNAFIAVFDPTGANLLYSTLFGDTILDALACEQAGTCNGIADTFGIGVAVDASGSFYLAGETNGMELPTTAGVIQPTTGPEVSTSNQNHVAGIRGFIAKFNPVTTKGGTSLAYATYLGGLTANDVDTVNSIVTDNAGYAYVSGTTDSIDFPTTKGAYQTSCYDGAYGCGTAAFVAKLNPTGTVLEWSTYLGDATGNNDSVNFSGPIQLDGNGNVYVTGQTGGNFPFPGNMEPWTGNPVFVSELDPTGSKLLFSTEFGGGSGGQMNPGGLAVDSAGNMYVAMSDPCAGAIVTPGSFQQTNRNQGSGCGNYSSTGFVAKISATGTATVALAASPSPVAAGQSVTLTATITHIATYASVPTGTIEFQDGGNPLGTAVTLDGTGKATYTSATLDPGTHSLTAVYSGDSTYPAGNATQSLEVNGLTATVKVTPAAAGITTAMSLKVTVAVTGSGATPTGTVTLTSGTYTSFAVPLSGGGATISIPADSLAAGTDSLTVAYSGDTSYNSATGSGTVTVSTPATPTITVTPASNSINTATSLSVTVTVGGSGGVTPTGTVTLSGGGYTSAAVTLVNGAATIVIPANSLAVGNDTLTAAYSGDTNYASASGSTPASSPVTVAPAPIAPTVTVAPAGATANTGAVLSVPVTVSGSGATTPTGTVTLSGGGFTSTAATLVNGSYTFTIPSNSLSAGTDTLTAEYSGDSVYATGSATASVTVTQSAYSLAATTPTAVTAGSPATSTVTVSTATAYSGTIALTCALTTSPSGATDLPTCAVNTPSVQLASGSTSATSTITVTSTSATTAMALPGNDSKQNRWKRLGGGAALALLFFFGIPSRRRAWRAMLGVLLLMAAIGTISGCGGKSSSSSNKAGTTAGSYTFTVTGTGTPAETPTPTTTYTLTIN